MSSGFSRTKANSSIKKKEVNMLKNPAKKRTEENCQKARRLDRNLFKDNHLNSYSNYS